MRDGHLNSYATRGEAEVAAERRNAGRGAYARSRVRYEVAPLGDRWAAAEVRFKPVTWRTKLKWAVVHNQWPWQN